jgi:recombination protein RecR
MLSDIDQLAQLLARLPGLGPRSARRAVLHMLQRKEALMVPLAAALERTAASVNPCSLCGNLDTRDPCGICSDPSRNQHSICVVEQVGHIWSIQRSGVYRGLYHVLGGTLSALDGVKPEDLSIARLIERVSGQGVTEVILALNVTIEGAATAHYLADRLRHLGVTVSRLAQGVPIGGDLDYLDDGTLTAAFNSRKPAA